LKIAGLSNNPAGKPKYNFYLTLAKLLSAFCIVYLTGCRGPGAETSLNEFTSRAGELVPNSIGPTTLDSPLFFS
jgi:hypothetical protein